MLGVPGLLNLIFEDIGAFLLEFIHLLAAQLVVLPLHPLFLLFEIFESLLRFSCCGLNLFAGSTECWSCRDIGITRVIRRRDCLGSWIGLLGRVEGSLAPFRGWNLLLADMQCFASPLRPIILAIVFYVVNLFKDVVSHAYRVDILLNNLLLVSIGW